MSNVAPMTAAEYRAEQGILTTRGHRILAALEEREALLEQAKFGSADASVGALVRRIQEHPASGLYFKFPGSEATYSLDAFGLSAALDSLLPKEPEVVTGPSGWTYEKTSEFVRQNDHTNGSIAIRHADHENVPPCDRELVTKLLGGSQCLT